MFHFCHKLFIRLEIFSFFRTACAVLWPERRPFFCLNSKSTFRAAQIAYDYKLDVVTVHYAWPSGGALGLYVYDRDSSVFARDSLANFLQLITETNATDITVAAHSMGSYVTLEAMRTLSLKGKQRVIDRISTLLMAAPDIDVFEQQLRDIRRLPKATAVQVSKRDRALIISRRITGGRSPGGRWLQYHFTASQWYCCV